MKKRKAWILPTIVFSQFTGTSLWFAGNAILKDLQILWDLDAGIIGWMTSSVQLGFIIGTLIFAFLSIADRYSPRLIFMMCSIAGSLATLGIWWFSEGLVSLLVFRFLTGFFLAGIYPVGMKIAASWYETGLGKALGWLVGALVFGTAFPHLVKSLGGTLLWEQVIITVSLLAAAGGVFLFLLVPDGPYHKKASKFEADALFRIFRSKDFRAAAFGYFGHMWELYTFWAFVPAILALNQGTMSGDISFWAFLIIAAGGLGCIYSGMVSRRFTSQRMALIMLGISGSCCLLSPLIIQSPGWLFIGMMLIWGFTVVGDSPMFSTLAAKTAPPQLVGSALTIMNSIGFAITIVSIELVNSLNGVVNNHYLFIFLLPGPVLGVRAILPLLKQDDLF